MRVGRGIHMKSMFLSIVFFALAALPASALDPAALDAIAESLGGRGCILRDGAVVKAWGDQAERSDWMSAAKPVLSTLLFFAIEEGKVQSVDQSIADFGWDLQGKDRDITFRHLGAMTSGYMRPEGPGEAWAYNDFAIQLYQKTLFDKVYQDEPDAAANAPERFGALGLEDGLDFSKDKRRLRASVRDFARIAQFWMNRGVWNGEQVLPARYFDEFMGPQTPKDLPDSADGETADYLGIGSYGGGSAHFTRYGAGVYGFNWWFNETGGKHPDARLWPDAPADTVMAIGAGGNCAAIIPSLGIVLVNAKGDWGSVKGGDADAKTNRVLAQLAGAAADGPALSGRVWQPVTIDFEGPEVGEVGEPNPFLDYRLNVRFVNGGAEYLVPGYFAADGDAAESGADRGKVWRVHFTPDRAGEWTYEASFRHATDVAVSLEPEAGEPTAFDGATGTIAVAEADPNAPGFLSQGMLRYVGGRYLQFAGTGAYYIKGGADSPENMLGYADFDDTKPRHRFEPHMQDWREGDPTWRGGKGKGIVGAMNYLAGMGMNSVYFITMNVEGDGKDTWPWIAPDKPKRFDCSKLDQWEIVFGHMTRLGLALHVVLQEQENDQLLDGGELGLDRKIYFRELIARFGHHPALFWNLGEENTNTYEQQVAFGEYIGALDPYDHPVVLHTFPSKREAIYRPLLGNAHIDGPSLQLGNMNETHEETLKWLRASEEAGRTWIVCLDEIGPASIGVVPDSVDPEHDDVRRHCLWGNLMAGGAGVEWFFGKAHGPGDVSLEDWRTRHNVWAQTKVALDFFHEHLPFPDMTSANDLVTGGDAWCFAKSGQVYAVYTLRPGETTLTLPDGAYSVHWYNPRTGGALTEGGRIAGPGAAALGEPPAAGGRDWVALVRREP